MRKQVMVLVDSEEGYAERFKEYVREPFPEEVSKDEED